MSHVMAITREALQAGELASRAEVEDAKERELQLSRGLLSSTCGSQQIEDIYRYCAYPQGAFDPAPVVVTHATFGSMYWFRPTVLRVTCEAYIILYTN